MVEDRPEVVNAVSGDERPVGVARLKADDLEDVLTRVRLELDSNAVRVEALRSGDLVFEHLQVLLGPPELPIAPVESGVHELPFAGDEPE